MILIVLFSVRDTLFYRELQLMQRPMTGDDADKCY